jgi:hypothetical protein
MILLHFKTIVIKPPIGTNTEKRVRVFLVDLSIKLLEYRVLIKAIERIIKIKLRTKTV